jgi:hypothetical protein
MNLVTSFGHGLGGAACLLAIAVQSLLVPAPTPRRRVLAGALLLGLALASQIVSGGSDDPAAHAISIGILSFGVALALSQTGLVLWKGGQALPTRIATLCTGIVVLGLGLNLARPAIDIGAWPTAATIAGLTLAALLLTSVTRLGPVSAGLRRLEAARSSSASATQAPSDAGPVKWAASLHLMGVLAALTVPHLHLYLAAILCGVLGGAFLERLRGRSSRWLFSLVPSLLGFFLSWFLLTRVAGEQSLRLSELMDAPYSPAFELLAALLLGLVAWSLLGLWPWLFMPVGPATPILGATLLVRLIAPVLPYGLHHWQPILYPLVAVAAWHAAVVKREDESLTALASLGLLSGERVAGWAGVALVAAAILLRPDGWSAKLGRRWATAAVWMVIPLATLLTLPILSAALTAQAFYTTVTVAGAAVALWRGPPPLSGARVAA